jgi:hypothetical protein
VLFFWAGDGPEKIVLVLVLVLVLDWGVSLCPGVGSSIVAPSETSGPNSASWAVPGSRLLDADRAAI